MFALATMGVRAEQRVGIGALPDNLVRIKITPADLHGASLAGAGGRQNFVFADKTRITVEAPETYKGLPFAYWRIQRPIGHPPEIVRNCRTSLTLVDHNYLILAHYGAADSSSGLSGAGGYWPGSAIPGLPGLDHTLPSALFGAAPASATAGPDSGVTAGRPSFGIPPARRQQLFEQAQRQFGPPQSAQPSRSGSARKTKSSSQSAKDPNRTSKTLTPE